MWQPRRFATTRWDAARQRRWVAEQARRRDLVVRDGEQPPKPDRAVLTAAAIAGAALVLAALTVAVWAWIHP